MPFGPFAPLKAFGAAVERLLRRRPPPSGQIDWLAGTGGQRHGESIDGKARCRPAHHPIHSARYRLLPARGDE